MLNVVFAGIFARTQLAPSGGSPTANQVQLEMVCLKAKPGSGSEDGDASSTAAASGEPVSATATQSGPVSASSTGAAALGVQKAGSLLGFMGLAALLPVL